MVAITALDGTPHTVSSQTTIASAPMFHDEVVALVGAAARTSHDPLPGLSGGYRSTSAGGVLWPNGLTRVRAAATVCSPTSWDPLIKTMSPGRSCWCSTLKAASLSGTCSTLTVTSTYPRDALSPCQWWVGSRSRSNKATVSLLCWLPSVVHAPADRRRTQERVQDHTSGRRGARLARRSRLHQRPRGLAGMAAARGGGRPVGRDVAVIGICPARVSRVGHGRDVTRTARRGTPEAG